MLQLLLTSDYYTKHEAMLLSPSFSSFFISSSLHLCGRCLHVRHGVRRTGRARRVNRQLGQAVVATGTDGAIGGAQLTSGVKDNGLSARAVDGLEVGTVEADTGLDAGTREIGAEVGGKGALDAEDILAANGVGGHLAVDGGVDTSGVDDFT